MSDLTAAIIGTSIGGAFGLLLVVSFVLYFCLPILAFVAVLNLRRMRIAVERLSNTAEAAPGWTRTGPLEIRHAGRS